MTPTSPSTNATCVALPTNQPIAPERNKGELMRVTNQEQAFHPDLPLRIHRRQPRKA